MTIGRVTLLIFLCSLFPVMLRGEEGGFVVPHFDYLMQGPISVPSDETVFVQIRDFVPDDHPFLRARFFRGTKADLIRYPTYVSPVGAGGSACYVYTTWTALRVRRYSGGVDVGRLPRIPRLNEHWVVAFEDGNWSGGKVKISKDAVGKYFAGAFEFIVTPSGLKSKNSTGISALQRIEMAMWKALNPVPDIMSAQEEQRASDAGRMSAIKAAMSSKVACIHFSDANGALLASSRPCKFPSAVAEPDYQSQPAERSAWGGTPAVLSGSFGTSDSQVETPPGQSK